MADTLHVHYAISPDGPGRDGRLDRWTGLCSIGCLSYLPRVAALGTRDVSALLGIVEIGARDTGSEPFPSAVLQALSEVIPSDACVGYQEADVRGAFRAVDVVEVVGEPVS